MVGNAAAFGSYMTALEPSEELTLEAALAFVDGCSVDSDAGDGSDDDEPLSITASGRSRRTSHSVSTNARSKSSNGGGAARREAPPSPRFFALVDDFQQGIDIEEDISVEDVLRLVDAGADTPGSAKTRSELKKRRLSRQVQSASDSDSLSSSKAMPRPARKARHARAEPAEDEHASPKLASLAPTENAASERPTANDAGDATQAPVDTVNGDSNAVPKPKKKRIRRQREELLYLRAKVAEMQQMLEDLQNGNFPSESGSSSSESPASSPVAHQRPPSSSTTSQHGAAAMRRMHWKILAQTQLAERQRAEQENQHLKATLDGQMQLTKRLERLIISQDPPEVRISVLLSVLFHTDHRLLCFSLLRFHHSQSDARRRSEARSKTTRASCKSSRRKSSTRTLCSNSSSRPATCAT